jgi:lantibiotic leader peptide-processing serine protease
VRKLGVSILLAGMVAAMGLPAGVAGAGQGPAREYVVVYADGASLSAARAAVKGAGGTIVRENTAVGVATVRSTNRGFLAAANAHAALFGAARNIAIGHSPKLQPKDSLEADLTAGAGQARPVLREAAPAGTSVLQAEPLADLQWGMQMIEATVDGSYAVHMGDPGVLVGIMDTGIDASHPDLADRFDPVLSRNFTTDIPLVDGPCEEEPDQSCEDPADVDENGHGTHVAGIAAASYNEFGLAGVAPGVTLVNLRAGQDSGYFFLQPTVDALTHAGENGIDVVNMSFFIDPWLFNCRNNPADSPEAQQEQRTIIAATQRALDFAHLRDVTLIASAGNGHTDLGHPTEDDISPDFPPGSEYLRMVNNRCLVLPTEGNNVMSITSLGPSGRKSFFSDYGVEQTTVSAPGGDSRDFFGTPQYLAPENRILSSFPESVLRESGLIDESGRPLTPFVVRFCRRVACGYYAYLQGTSMSSPHATGVAALIVSGHGTTDPNLGGLTMDPAAVEQMLRDTAVDTACPAQNPFDYPDLPDEYTAFCEGTTDFNGFYGDGIVNALNAVS